MVVDAKKYHGTVKLVKNIKFAKAILVGKIYAYLEDFRNDEFLSPINIYSIEVNYYNDSRLRFVQPVSIFKIYRI